MVVNSLLEAALQYAGRGWHIFPCKPRGKTPLVKGGFKAATTDREQLEKWWQKWPDANIGLATGAVSGLIVFDLDGPDGIQSMKELCGLLGGPLPMAPTVMTARGLHIYYRLRPDSPQISCSAAKGLDIRSNGGYVIAPPSVHESGHEYFWLGLRVAPGAGNTQTAGTA